MIWVRSCGLTVVTLPPLLLRLQDDSHSGAGDPAVLALESRTWTPTGARIGGLPCSAATVSVPRW
jgi:hypothetical protein